MAVDKNGKQLNDHTITKYNNDLNNLVARKFSSSETDIFWSVITQLVETTKNEAVFDYSEIAKKIGYKGHKKQLSNVIDEMSKHLLNLQVYQNSYTSDGQLKFRNFNAFTEFEGDPTTKKLKVYVHPAFMPYINELGNKYTRFLLAQLTSLESKYSKNLFRLLKQYRTTGVFRCQKDKLYALLGMPNSYTSRINLAEKRVLKPAIKELTERGYFENLRMKKHYSKGVHGKPKITGFEFTFTPQKGQDDLNDVSSRENVQDGKFKKVDVERLAKEASSGNKEALDALLQAINVNDTKVKDSDGKDITNDEVKTSNDDSFSAKKTKLENRKSDDDNFGFF